MPLKNEAYQSVISRHLARSAGTPAKNLRSLGLTGASAINILPNSIQNLPSRIPEAHPWASGASHIVSNHTTIPLILSFSSPPVFNNLLSRLSHGESANPIATLGLTIEPARSTLFDRELKFCPQCVEQDLETYGFPAFYTHHQPKFVKICPHHLIILHSLCRHCAPTLSSAKTWRLPNSCLCPHPNSQQVVDSTMLPTHVLEELSQLAKRTLTVIDQSQTALSLALDLHSKLLKAGLVCTSGVTKHAAIKDLITSSYSSDFLRTLGLESWARKRRGRAIPLTSKASCIPNALQCILVFDALEGYERPQPPTPARQRLNIPDKDTVMKAMQASELNFDKVAETLGIGWNRLITTLRRHEIEFPLSSLFINRVGIHKLESIRSALKSGLPIKQIRRQFAISPWSLDLIRLDDLELDKQHRNTILEERRLAFRNVISDFIRLNNSATRSSIRKAHPNALKVLYEIDRPWLDKNLPLAKPYQGYERPKHRIDIAQLDEQFVQAIREQARIYLAKPDRPKRLAATTLLKSVGISAILGPKPRSPRCKRAFAEAHLLAETLEEFEVRLINWSIREYAKLHIPISTNKLRRVARIPAQRLQKSRKLIIELAESLDIGFDSRCTLSSTYHSQLTCDLDRLDKP